MNFNLKTVSKIAFWASVLGIFAFIFDYGFETNDLITKTIDGFYFIVITLGLISTFGRYILNPKLLHRKVVVFDALTIIYTFYVIYHYLFVGKAFTVDLILEQPIWIVLAIVLSFIREFSERQFSLDRSYLNPAQTFIISFIVIILLGTLLLMLPNATNGGLSYIDALFTATSAVCVTGLAVVDTGTYFTLFGQTILLFLIQVGGLGILTFASYFSYFFKGGSSYENQLTLSEMTSTNKVGAVFSTLKNIIIITFTVELTSAVLIFISIGEEQFKTLSERLFFSVFHGISAFCNAGFSTMSSSAYEESVRFNYPFQLILAGTLIMGGLGFPIVVNIINYVRERLLFFFSFGKKRDYTPWALNLNSRITLITTLSLTAITFVLFFILEYDNTLAEHSLWGKVVHAFFGAATPRTAGFNSVDMSQLAFPTVMITFLLMWVGASPASTGGGIKTSTFAIATLNIFSLARGKDRIEIFGRELSDVSVRRAFATITLSLIVIGYGVLLISMFEPEKRLIDISFECFSAYSTVGLSLGITSALTVPSKVVLIAIMFVGRISMLTLVVAIFDKVKPRKYHYPKEELTIN